MAPRTGRPTTEKKENRKSYRFSNQDMEKLQICMERTGMTETDIIRKGINLVYEEVIKK